MIFLYGIILSPRRKNNGAPNLNKSRVFYAQQSNLNFGKPSKIFLQYYKCGTNFELKHIKKKLET